MVYGNKTDLHHAELQRPRIQKDEKAVLAVVDLIQGLINPFSEKQELVRISTAKVAPKDITSDLMRAYEIGEQSYATFKNERLEKDPPAKKFYDTMKTNRLKTFSSMCKKKEVKSSGRAIILKADRSLFGRISDGTSTQSLDRRHPLPSAWSITLGSVNTRRITQKDQQSLFTHNTAKKCDRRRATT